MKAVGYYESMPIEHNEALVDIEIPEPKPERRDLLVRVQAVSVNPVDFKVRKNRTPTKGKAEVLGWDAVGVVEALGEDVESFKVGDRVYYAGAINRPGSNSELQIVDERIVGLAPKTLNDGEAAALPLTTITAYELLYDRLAIQKESGDGESILIIGAAGGVGSILIQLARQLTNLNIIATASRAESREWCLSLGAHIVIDHSKPIAQGLKDAGLDEVDYVAGLNNTQDHFEQIIECTKPQGSIVVIDDSDSLDVGKLKSKSISLHNEFMFTRSLYQTKDMNQQGKLLTCVANLVEQGKIKTTSNNVLGKINAENLRRAHSILEKGKTTGKIVLVGF